MFSYRTEEKIIEEAFFVQDIWKVKNVGNNIAVYPEDLVILNERGKHTDWVNSYIVAKIFALSLR